MRTVKCLDCDGFGYLDDDGDIECSNCNGDGVIEGHSGSTRSHVHPTWCKCQRVCGGDQ